MNKAIKKSLSPCFACEEREIGCHSICTRFFLYKLKLKQIKQVEERENKCSFKQQWRMDRRFYSQKKGGL